MFFDNFNYDIVKGMCEILYKGNLMPLIDGGNSQINPLCINSTFFYDVGTSHVSTSKQQEVFMVSPKIELDILIATLNVKPKPC